MTSARVDVLEGPDAGRSVDLPLGARLVIGRGHEADLRLSDAQVSRRHCALEHGLAGVKVVDLESRGGCVVEQEGRRCAPPALVTGRARVELGATVLALARWSGAQPLAPQVRGVRLLRVLGEGGSGTVWEGVRDDGVAVALKVLLPEADPIARARFEREADLAARLQHPGIARILGLAQADDGRPCLVRELVRGRSLLARIDEGGALDWREVATIGGALADALAHAHARGVVHRDVKPGNVVVEEPGGAARLIDFDLARRLVSTSEQARATVVRLTATGEGLGSLAYVAPEQLHHARDADARSDLYGLGLTLYHAAGGVAPIWRTIAKYAIGVGFEPDARDAAKLRAANSPFKRWVFCEGLVAPSVADGAQKKFFLTRSPHCSSLLKPRHDLLQDWTFADYFIEERTTSVPAVTLQAGLAANGLHGVDWLKCDTQGLDLSIFLSLPEDWRRRTLAVEFEPGFIDAYEGEDKLWRTLQAMEAEPFWLCDLQAGCYPRGNPVALAEILGERMAKWLPRTVTGAPVYASVRYLRTLRETDPHRGAGAQLDRRGLLLSWVFADLVGQHTHALLVAREGITRFNGELFEDMLRASRWRLRRAMARRMPAWLWQRFGLPG